MKLCRYNSQKGFTIIEVLVALFIIALVILGGGMFFFYGRVNIVREAHRRAAVLVASQRLEELKAAEWGDIDPEIISGDETVTVDNVPDAKMVTQAWYVNDEGGTSEDYVKVMVTVNWVDSRSNSVSATTLIAPR